MNKNKPCAIAMLILMATLIVTSISAVPPVSAQTGQDWTMFKFNPAHTGITTNTAPDQILEKWRFETGGPCPSSPAVVSGKVYIGSYDKNLYCLDGETGTLVWKYTTGGVISSSPAVIDGKVYFGSVDKNVYCVSASDGTLIWKFSTGGEVYSTANVADGKVFIGSFDKNVYALNALTGDKIWNFTTGNKIFKLCPTVADGKVFIGSMDTYLYSLNETTGAMIWKFKGGNSFGESSAVVVDNKVFVGCDDQKVYCLNETSGAKLWSFNTPDTYSQQIMETTVSVTDGKVYAGFYGGVFILDEATGALQLVCGTGHIQRSSNTISNGKIYVGCNDLVFYVFDATTGKRVTSYFASGPWESSPAIANGKIYIGNGNGFVYCFDQKTTAAVAETISLSVRPASQELGKQVTVEGHLMPGVVFVNILLTYTKPDGTTMTKTVSTSLDAKFTHSFTPDVPGDWSVQAQFTAFGGYGDATSQVVNFAVTGTVPEPSPASSTITCSASVTSAGDFSVKGAIAPAVSGATVTLTYYKPDATSITRTVTTASDGTYTDSFKPTATGNWHIQASRPGDSTYEAAVSTLATAPSTSTSAAAASSTAISIDWIYVLVALVVIVLIIVAILAFTTLRKK